MKRVVFLLFVMFLVVLYACESNCVACHPKLIKKNGQMDSDHKILTTCIKCHTKKSMQKVDMGVTSCGEDCWKCHNIKKVAKVNIKEHKALNKCIKCHTKNIKNIFDFDDKKSIDHQNLIDILNQ